MGFDDRDRCPGPGRVRAPLVFPGATDTQAFQTYVDQVLVPELRPGDVVVFDNLKPHLFGTWRSRSSVRARPLAPAAIQLGLRPDRGLVVEVQGTASPDRGADKGRLYKAVGETLDSVTIQDISAGSTTVDCTQLMGKTALSGEKCLDISDRRDQERASEHYGSASSQRTPRPPEV